MVWKQNLRHTSGYFQRIWFTFRLHISDFLIFLIKRQGNLLCDRCCKDTHIYPNIRIQLHIKANLLYIRDNVHMIQIKTADWEYSPTHMRAVVHSYTVEYSQSCTHTDIYSWTLTLRHTDTCIYNLCTHPYARTNVLTTIRAQASLTYTSMPADAYIHIHINIYRQECRRLKKIRQWHWKDEVPLKSIAHTRVRAYVLLWIHT